jgi:hypothetical protein
MVRIVGGEIVADDDPRVASQTRATAVGGAGAPHTQGAATTTGFDLRQPALRLAPNPAAPGGLPDVVVFGVSAPGAGVLALAGLGVLAGWRAALLGGILGAVWLLNNNTNTNGGAGGAGHGGGGAAGGGGALGQLLGGAFGGAGRQQSAGSGLRRQQQQQQQQQQQSPKSQQQRPHQGSSSSAFQGKSYKLSGST